MERRDFVKGLAAMAAATQALPELVAGAQDRIGRFEADLLASRDMWKHVRNEFHLHPGLVHLNTGSTGACPQMVTEGVADALAEYEGDPFETTFGIGLKRAEQVRARAAEFIGADLTELSITRNTSEGMNQVATGIDLAPGDEILTTNHEHGGGLCCWELLAALRGLQINRIKMPAQIRDAAQFVRLV